MLASINPLGERGRQQRYSVTVTAYVVASTVAGVALGGALGGVGHIIVPVPALALAAVAVAAAGGLVVDTGVAGLRVSGPRRQVNEDWLTTYRGWVYGTGFGAQLGFAFSTIVVASVTWAAFACALCSASVEGGALIGGTFGLLRAVPVLMVASARDPRALRIAIGRLDAFRPRVASLTTALQAMASVAVALALVVRLA
jgi:hypothetical protein